MAARYLNREEAAERLQISIRSLERIYKTDKELPYYVFKRRIRFKESDIENWEESRRVEV